MVHRASNFPTKHAVNSSRMGFTLIELTVVMVIVALLFAMIMPVTSAVLTGQKRKTTELRLAAIEGALANYVLINRRLPCPADGLANTGTENRVAVTGDCVGNQASGVVPWATIGLATSDILDGWDNRVTYRVAYGLTQDNALDMSLCDPAGTKATNPPAPTPPAVSVGRCDATCTGVFSPANCTSPQNYLTQKGLNVSDGAAVVMNYTTRTGAAYVLISHGQNGYGAITNAAGYQATESTGVAGTTLENANRNLPGLTVTNNAPPTFVHAGYSDLSDATTYFDDIVVRPTIMSLANKAHLGPRSH